MITTNNLKLLLEIPYYYFTDRGDSTLFFYKRKVSDAFLASNSLVELISFILSKIKNYRDSDSILDITEFYDEVNEAYLTPFTDSTGVIYNDSLSEDEYIYLILQALIYCQNLGYKIEVSDTKYIVEREKGIQEFTHILVHIKK